MIIVKHKQWIFGNYVKKITKTIKVFGGCLISLQILTFPSGGIFSNQGSPSGLTMHKSRSC